MNKKPSRGIVGYIILLSTILLIAVLLNGMTLLSINAYYQVLLKGLVLIFAIYIDQVRQIRNARKIQSA